MKDAKLILNDDQSIISGVGTVNGGNVIDLGAQANFWGTSEVSKLPNDLVRVYVEVITTVTGGATVQAILKESATEAMGSPTSIITGTATSANPAAGTILLNQVVPLSQALRYLRLDIVIGTASATAGAVRGFLAPAATGGIPTRPRPSHP